MSSDVECPYCGADQEVCYDDGHGCSEGELYEAECTECGKGFVFDTGIIFVHSAHKAPCLNGEPHNWKHVSHHPELWPDWKRCTYCDYEIRGEYKEQTNE